MCGRTPSRSRSRGPREAQGQWQCAHCTSCFDQRWALACDADAGLGGRTIRAPSGCAGFWDAAFVAGTCAGALARGRRVGDRARLVAAVDAPWPRSSSRLHGGRPVARISRRNRSPLACRRQLVVIGRAHQTRPGVVSLGQRRERFARFHAMQPPGVAPVRQAPRGTPLPASRQRALGNVQRVPGRRHRLAAPPGFNSFSSLSGRPPHPRPAPGAWASAARACRIRAAAPVPGRPDRNPWRSWR